MKKFEALLILMVACLLWVVGCGGQSAPPASVSMSGVKEVTAEVKVGADGLTSEQRNVKFKNEKENAPGSIKHLYLISPFSSKVTLYSTIQGKLTSSGKRLSPTTVTAGTVGTGNGSVSTYGIPVKIGGQWYNTNEVLQDDGTYGSSVDYIYWKDAKGLYHQHIKGLSEIHVCEEPIRLNTDGTISIEILTPEK